MIYNHEIAVHYQKCGGVLVGATAKINYQKRDLRIDILKAIGIICVILAHTIPNESLIFQIRNFDVPLMVIASGTLFYYSSRNKNISFWNYLKTRIPRLIAPVWLFAVFYFVATFLIYDLVNKAYPYDFKDFINSLRLVGDAINYFWIVRVFVLVAIASPLLLKLYQYLQNEVKYFLVLLSIYIGYRALFYLSETSAIDLGVLENTVENYVYYGIPYSCLFGLGIALPNLQKRSLKFIALFFLAAFIVLLAYSLEEYGRIISTQELKYPPSLYYFSYGALVTLLLFTVTGKWMKQQPDFAEKYPVLIRFIVFLSTSSLWIYLWHIFFLQCWVLFAPGMFEPPTYLITFLGIATLSIATTYFQKQLFSNLIEKTRLGRSQSDLLSTLFLK
jgi:fucose 4-O-acetylase-like acetyltransferase